MVNALLGRKLRDRRATPLRGFGTLRLLEVEWDMVTGKLLFFDFNQSLREAIYESVRGDW